MEYLGWAILVVAALVTFYYILARWLIGGRTLRRRHRRSVILHEERINRAGERDLGANINPSQHGNELDLFPDRTGARTRAELGARPAQSSDVSFKGDREEVKVDAHASRAPREPGHGSLTDEELPYESRRIPEPEGVDSRLLVDPEPDGLPRAHSAAYGKELPEGREPGYSSPVLEETAADARREPGSGPAAPKYRVGNEITDGTFVPDAGPNETDSPRH